VKHEQIKRYYDDLYGERGASAFGCDRNRYTAWLRVLPPVPWRGTRVLDIGCGAGEFVAFVAAQGATVAGTDISAAALDIARQRVPAGEFHVASAESILPFPNGSFDVVVCLGVLEHVPTAPTLVAEARRVLTSAGLALFVVPNRYSPYYLLGRGTGQIEEAPRSRGEWRMLFENSGFRVRSISRDRGPTIVRDMRRSTAVKTLLNRMLNLGPVDLTYQFVFALESCEPAPVIGSAGA